MLMALSACQYDRIPGTWIQPVPGYPTLTQGIHFEKDGSASTIDMPAVEYTSWKREGDNLIVKGKNIGYGVAFSFTDTLKIVKLTTDSLVLQKGSEIQAYSRSLK